MADEQKDVRRVESTDETNLTNTLKTKMLGISNSTNPKLGYKKSTGDMLWFPSQGSDASFRNVTVDGIKTGFTQNVGMDANGKLIVYNSASDGPVKYLTDTDTKETLQTYIDNGYRVFYFGNNNSDILMDNNLHFIENSYHFYSIAEGVSSLLKMQFTADNTTVLTFHGFWTVYDIGCSNQWCQLEFDHIEITSDITISGPAMNINAKYISSEVFGYIIHETLDGIVKYRSIKNVFIHDKTNADVTTSRQTDEFLGRESLKDVTAGNGITIDKTDKWNPIISTTTNTVKVIMADPDYIINKQHIETAANEGYRVFYLVASDQSGTFELEGTINLPTGHYTFYTQEGYTYNQFYDSWLCARFTNVEFKFPVDTNPNHLNEIEFHGKVVLVNSLTFTNVPTEDIYMDHVKIQYNCNLINDTNGITHYLRLNSLRGMGVFGGSHLNMDTQFYASFVNRDVDTYLFDSNGNNVTDTYWFDARGLAPYVHQVQAGNGIIVTPDTGNTFGKYMPIVSVDQSALSVKPFIVKSAQELSDALANTTYPAKTILVSDTDPSSPATMTIGASTVNGQNFIYGMMEIILSGNLSGSGSMFVHTPRVTIQSVIIDINDVKIYSRTLQASSNEINGTGSISYERIVGTPTGSANIYGYVWDNTLPSKNDYGSINMADGIGGWLDSNLGIQEGAQGGVSIIHGTNTGNYITIGDDNEQVIIMRQANGTNDVSVVTMETITPYFPSVAWSVYDSTNNIYNDLNLQKSHIATQKTIQHANAVLDNESATFGQVKGFGSKGDINSVNVSDGANGWSDSGIKLIRTGLFDNHLSFENRNGYIESNGSLIANINMNNSSDDQFVVRLYQSDALIVNANNLGGGHLYDGVIKAPLCTIDGINDVGQKALVTKEYIDSIAGNDLAQVLENGNDGSKKDIINLGNLDSGDLTQTRTAKWQVAAPTFIGNTPNVTGMVVNPTANGAYTFQGNRDAGSDYGLFPFYRRGSTNWYLVREGWYWLVTNNIVAPEWATAIAYGAGNLDLPAGSYTPFNSETGTNIICSMTAGSTINQSFRSEGPMFCDEVIRANGGFNANGNLAINNDLIQYKDLASLRFMSNGSILAPDCAITDITSNTALTTKGYVDSKVGGGSKGNSTLNVSDGAGGWTDTLISYNSSGGQFITTNDLRFNTAGNFRINLNTNDSGSDQFSILTGSAGTIIFNIDAPTGKIFAPDLTNAEIAGEATTSKVLITKDYLTTNFAGKIKITANMSGTLNTNESIRTIFTVTGAAVGDAVIVNHNETLADASNGRLWYVSGARVSAANTVEVVITGLGYSSYSRSISICIIK
jgi:hypothetical protein